MNFVLSSDKTNTLDKFNRGETTNLTLLKTLLVISKKVATAKLLGSDRFLLYQHKQVWQLQEPFCSNY